MFDWIGDALSWVGDKISGAVSSVGSAALVHRRKFTEHLSGTALHVQGSGKQIL